MQCIWILLTWLGVPRVSLILERCVRLFGLPNFIFYTYLFACLYNFSSHEWKSPIQSSQCKLFAYLEMMLGSEESVALFLIMC